MELARQFSSVGKFRLAAAYMPWVQGVRLYATDWTVRSSPKRAACIMGKADFLGFLDVISITSATRLPSAMPFRLMSDGQSRGRAEVSALNVTMVPTGLQVLFAGGMPVMVELSHLDAVTFAAAARHTLMVQDVAVAGRSGGTYHLPLRGTSHGDRTKFLERYLDQTVPAKIEHEVVPNVPGHGYALAVRIGGKKELVGYVPAYMVQELYENIKLVGATGYRAWVRAEKSRNGVRAMVWIIFSGYHTDEEAAFVVTAPSPVNEDEPPPAPAVDTPPVELEDPADVAPPGVVESPTSEPPEPLAPSLVETPDQILADELSVPPPGDLPSVSTSNATTLTSEDAQMKFAAAPANEVVDIFGTPVTLDPATKIGIDRNVVAFKALTHPGKVDMVREKANLFTKCDESRPSESRRGVAAIRAQLVKLMAGAESFDKATPAVLEMLFARLMYSILAY